MLYKHGTPAVTRATKTTRTWPLKEFGLKNVRDFVWSRMLGRSVAGDGPVVKI